MQFQNYDIVTLSVGVVGWGVMINAILAYFCLPSKDNNMATPVLLNKKFTKKGKARTMADLAMQKFTKIKQEQWLISDTEL